MNNNNNIPIQESVLIELREDDAIKSTSEKNGEYTIHLQEPLTIKEGESIALKSGFVDSVAENSGQIFISEEEQDMEFDFFVQPFHTFRFQVYSFHWTSSSFD